MNKRENKTASLQITPHIGWSKQFWDSLVPLKDQIVRHPFFERVEAGTMPINTIQKALISFYPLVQRFPRYMALNLAKTFPAGTKGCQLTQSWLIENITVEQRHAEWWRLWALGFGCTSAQLDSIEPVVAVDSINHYLLEISTSGSIVEALGATNLAIEWPTGEWAKLVKQSAFKYKGRGVRLDSRRTLAWLNAHAVYDDEHPYEAMELIKLNAATEKDKLNAFNATRRGMEYYLLALNACL